MFDENNMMFKVLAGVLIFLIGILGAWASISMRSNNRRLLLSVGNCFAAGIFIGAGLIHTLGDSASLFNSFNLNIDFPIWAAIAAFSAGLLMWVDKGAHASLKHNGVSGLSLFIVLSLHSLLAGMAFGIEAHPMQALAILIAILSHKGSASFALGLQTNQSHYWRRMICFSLMTPIGVILGGSLIVILQNQNELLFEAVFDALAAGTFLYVALGEILPKEFENSQHSHIKSIAVMVGILLMTYLALYT